MRFFLPLLLFLLITAYSVSTRTFRRWLKLHRLVLSILCIIIFLSFTACSDTDQEGKSGFVQSNINLDSTPELDGYYEKEFRKAGGIFNKTGDISWDIGNKYIGQYKIFHLAENRKIVGYNENRHLLELIDIDEQRIYTTIPFEREGPKGIREVTGVYYHNKDSIFVISDFHLLLIDEYGDIKYNLQLNQTNLERNDLKGFDFSSFVLVPGQNKPIHFYAPQQALIIPMHSIAYSQWAVPEYYQGPVCAKVMLRTREVETIPLSYSEEYRENTYGLANKPFFTYNDELVIVGFNNSSRLFSYNLENKRLSVHNNKSEYYREMPPYTAAAGDQFAMIDYVSKNGMYDHIRYVPGKNRYYLLSAIQKENSSSLKFRLAILNDELETVCEFTLPDSFSPSYMLSFPNGLAFRDRSKTTDTASVYQLMDIDCK